jgi:hypothetical protein
MFITRFSSTPHHATHNGISFPFVTIEVNPLRTLPRQRRRGNGLTARVKRWYMWHIGRYLCIVHGVKWVFVIPLPRLVYLANISTCVQLQNVCLIVVVACTWSLDIPTDTWTTHVTTRHLRACQAYVGRGNATRVKLINKETLSIPWLVSLLSTVGVKRDKWPVFVHVDRSHDVASIRTWQVLVRCATVLTVAAGGCNLNQCHCQNTKRGLRVPLS